MMARSLERFSLLTWNIYGLESKHLHERTVHICDFVQRENPTVVFLQEVVQWTWPIITANLVTNYHCYQGKPKAFYFNAVLIRKSPDMICPEKEDVVDFPGSRMGRYLINVPVHCHGKTIHFMTSHIESLDKEHNIHERKNQIKTAFGMMQQYADNSLLSIFGGDMNTYDKEIQEIGLPSSVIDVWEACGSYKAEKFTFNSEVLVKRLDRVYLGQNSDIVKAVGFHLVGRDKIAKLGCHPSDHLGVWIDFTFKI
jgi:tyrosyl-DNA phosphodiesterase 2